MHSTCALRCLSRGVLVMLGTLALTAAHPMWTPTARGVTFAIRITLVAGPNQQVTSALTGRGTFVNGRGRIDFDSTVGRSAAFGRNDYLLIDSSGTTLVRPETRTYSEIDSPLQGPIERLAGRVGSQATVSAVNVEMDKLGPTDSVSGRTSQHYRITAEYTVELPRGPLHSRTTTELWMAKLPFQLSAPFAQLSPQADTGPFKAVFAKMREHGKQLASEGTPIKAVVTTNYTFGAVTINSMETAQLTDIREADVDESRLKVPEGFKRGG
jgi:hypothetical protein